MRRTTHGRDDYFSKNQASFLTTSSLRWDFDQTKVVLMVVERVWNNAFSCDPSGQGGRLRRAEGILVLVLFLPWVDFCRSTLHECRFICLPQRDFCHSSDITIHKFSRELWVSPWFFLALAFKWVRPRFASSCPLSSLTVPSRFDPKKKIWEV